MERWKGEGIWLSVWASINVKQELALFRATKEEGWAEPLDKVTAAGRFVVVSVHLRKFNHV